jgi:hypothetical protein
MHLGGAVAVLSCVYTPHAGVLEGLAAPQHVVGFDQLL